MITLSRVVAALIVVAPFSAMAAPKKPAIVLVHGAFETSEVWGQVTKKLQNDGYDVKNVALPGRRGNPLAPGDVSLALYQKSISEAIASETRPVVLVGHSFGGFAISAEAEAEPTKIKTLVYVAAYIPKNGQSLLTLATADKDSKLGPILKIDKEGGHASVDPAAGSVVFANDAPANVQAMVAAGIVDEPLAPLATPVTLSAARFGKVDKVAIHTLRDEVVSPRLQTTMARTVSLRLTMTIDTGHTPFITKPDRLATEIERAAR